jgi:hypothetical protein
MADPAFSDWLATDLDTKRDETDAHNRDGARQIVQLNYAELQL